MNKIEIETIIEALQSKQSWIVKEFNDFLGAWANATDGFPEAKKITVYTINADYDTSGKEYFLTTGSDQLDYQWSHPDGSTSESKSYPMITAALVRKIAPNLENSIVKFFRNQQIYIEKLSVAGRAIDSLLTKLI